MEFLNIGCSTVKDGFSGQYTREDLLDILKKYRSLEVRHIEFSHLHNMSEEDAGVLCDDAKSIGVIPWSVHTRGIPQLTEELLQRFENEAKLAQILGAKILVFHPNPKNSDGTIQMECYEAAADIAKKYGRTLALETGIFFHYTELIALVDTIARPYVGINIDTGHSHLRDRKDVEEVVRAVGPRLVTLHCQDNYGIRDDHQAPGFGFINWAAVLRALKESSYNGPVMLEMTDSGKSNRTVSQLGTVSIEQEISSASGWLKWLWSQI